MWKCVWLRVQETPYELCIAALCAASAVINCIALPLTPLLTVTLVALFVGGLITTVGRLRNAMHTESAGLAAMLAAFVFVTFYQLSQRGLGPLAIASALLSTGSLMIATAIRLYVVRRAVNKAVPEAEHIAMDRE